MDRREATRVIKELLADRDNDSRYPCVSSPRHYEALDLAIEALEREIEYGQMVVDFTKGETMKSDEWKYDTTCDAESATTTDCISRADTIKAMCAECDIRDCGRVCTTMALIRDMPSCNHTCNQKQVTSKLKNPYDSLLKPDSDECKEQKSKLDCISRQHAVEDIKEHANTITDALIILENFPPVTPTVSEDCISREQVRAKLDYISYAEKDPITIAKRIVDNAPSVTPTERTGEWIEHDPRTKGLAKIYECPFCGDEVVGEKTNFCPNCGAKNKGGTENE